MWQSWKLLTDGQQFTVHNLDQLDVLKSFAHKTTCHDMTLYSVESDVKPLINKKASMYRNYHQERCDLNIRSLLTRSYPIWSDVMGSDISPFQTKENDTKNSNFD